MYIYGYVDSISSICNIELTTDKITTILIHRRYELFKGLFGAFDEERRRFRARLREQELLMQVHYNSTVQYTVLSA